MSEELTEKVPAAVPSAVPSVLHFSLDFSREPSHVPASPRRTPRSWWYHESSLQWVWVCSELDLLGIPLEEDFREASRLPLSDEVLQDIWPCHFVGFSIHFIQLLIACKGTEGSTSTMLISVISAKACPLPDSLIRHTGVLMSSGIPPSISTPLLFCQPAL